VLAPLAPPAVEALAGANDVCGARRVPKAQVRRDHAALVARPVDLRVSRQRHGGRAAHPG